MNPPAASRTAALPPGPRYPRLTLATSILGTSVAFIDGSAMNVALPALAHGLAAGPAGLSWSINAYLLPLGALILLGGSAGDRFGRRRLFLLGLGAFTAASLLCAMAPSLPWLLAARFLQGSGAALLLPNSLAILGTAFTGEARGRAVGIWAASGALAAAIGPVLGGWLITTVGWRAIFLLNVPVGAAACLLALAFVAETNDGRRGMRLDWAGAALVTAGLGILTWALSAASGPGAGAPLIGTACAAGVALLVAFAMLENLRGERALMPLSLLVSPGYLGLSLLTFFLYGGLGGFLVLVPFLLIQIAHWSPMAAGAALLPIPLAIGVGSPIMGGVAARHGGRLPLAGGAALVAAGFAWLVRLHPGAIDYKRELLPAIALVALGLALSVAPLTASVMASVEPGRVGAASGLNSAVARIAGLVATALLGFVFALQGSAASFLAGFRAAAIVGAVAAALSAASALWLVGAERPKG